MEKDQREKYLFAIDLDGTVLSNSITNEIHPRTIEAIKMAREQGHIVSIITGRPWVSTKEIYEKLELDTIVGNINGAHIHNPCDPFFIDYIRYVNLNEMLYILSDKKLKNLTKNYAIEGPGWVQIDKRDEELEQIFGFNKLPKFSEGIDLGRIPLKPIGVVLDIDFQRADDMDIMHDAMKLKKYLDRKYGDLAEFNYWSKGDDNSKIFDITALGVSKAKVISLLLRFYDINAKNTVAIGDGFNDISMLKLVEHSVAMANADDNVKKYANYVSELTNKEGGVGEFIINFLNNLKNK
ncbi:MAG: Cof-type HAD-IIB family hydrolase [Metamycoplasmataceae bacterium]